MTTDRCGPSLSFSKICGTRCFHTDTGQFKILDQSGSKLMKFNGQGFRIEIRNFAEMSPDLVCNTYEAEKRKKKQTPRDIFKKNK